MEHKKRTGVKFCGGCHISYDRSDALQKIMSASTCIYENVKDDTEYDNLLVLCSCTSRCAEFRQYKVKYHTIVLDAYPEETKIKEIGKMLC